MSFEDIQLSGYKLSEIMLNPDRNNANVVKSANQYKHDTFEYMSKKLALEHIKKRYKGEEIVKAYKDGYFHIHDLASFISQPHNCYNLDMRSVEKKGLDIYNGCKATEPKHIESFLNQITEYLTLVTSEISGGVCLPFFNLYLQPFWTENKKRNTQAIQSFLYRLNQINGSRSGAMFSSINLYLNVDKYNKKYDSDYSEKISEEIVNTLIEVLIEGDANDNPFLFPNTVFNITDVDLNKYPKIFKLTSKYYTSYFLVDREDFKDEKALTVALGCRTQLHTNFTGEITDIVNSGNAVYNTLNLPMLALQAKKDDRDNFLEKFKTNLKYSCDLLYELTHHRINQIEYVLNEGYMHYIKNYFDYDIKNQTFVIGVVGLEEASEILFDKPLKDNVEEMKTIISFLREIVDGYKEKDGLRWAFFSTPSESYQGGSAKVTMKRFGFDESKAKGTYNTPYYSNGVNLDSGAEIDIITQIKVESEFALLCNGGNLNNFHIGAQTEADVLQNLTEKIRGKTDIRFFAFTGAYIVCQSCGSKYSGEGCCPNCYSCDVINYSRVTGYYRPTFTFNSSRFEEYSNRTSKL